jgi:hypothetical protein
MSIDWRAELAAAEKETGLSDWGGTGFHDGLIALVDASNRDPRSNPQILQRVRAQIHTTLVNRLKIYRDRALYPEIAAQRIEKPIFVIGLPRSGTTILHALLAQDPQARSPLTWECDDPSPPPRAETFETDPRIAVSQARADAAPLEMKRMHFSGAQLPQECGWLTQPAFRTTAFNAINHIPPYEEWYLKSDDRPAYEMHRHMVQHLQAFAPKSWWVFKFPPHMFHLPAIVEAYPDARFVFPHRDPAATLPSLSSLTAYLREMTYGSVDRAALGPEIAKFWREGLYRTLAYRADPANEHRFVDVHYEETIRSPMEAVRRVYDKFELPLTDAAVQSMEAFLKAQPKDKHGAHPYTLEQYGLSADQVHEDFSEYLEHYGVARVG